MMLSKLSTTIMVAMLLGPASADAQQPAPVLVKVAAAVRPAPEIVGIAQWLNSGPLRLADLRGKVVLVDFWTHGCINCVRTLPHVTGLYEKYKDRGFVVIGIHTPEFAFERSTANVA